MPESARQSTSAEVFFLTGAAGRLFTLYRPPKGEHLGTLVWVPPFAEEMNKSRRMMTLLAGMLNDKGIGVLLLDLFGTGDSEGDFVDARWHIWVQDLVCALQWLEQKQAIPINMLGHRLGALLALDAIKQQSLDIERLILWQPVTRGKNFLTQFLRLRVAAIMMDSNRERESTQGLRKTLEQGETVEVTGYKLHPKLAAAIDQQEFLKSLDENTPPIHWFDLSTKAQPSLAPASQKTISQCESKGHPIEAAMVQGEAFWSTAEITEAPKLIKQTSKIFGIRV